MGKQIGVMFFCHKSGRDFSKRCDCSFWKTSSPLGIFLPIRDWGGSLPKKKRLLIDLKKKFPPDL
jgi:hypothetical protein